MGIDEMLGQIKVQNLGIVGWIITKEKQLSKINPCSEKNL